MKATNFGTQGLPVALGGWSSGVTAISSNATVIGGLTAQNFVQRITSNGSNTLQNPIVNFAAGPGIALAAASNTITITGTTSGGTPGPPGASGALVLLEQHSASASAALDFTTFISATYDTYLIEGVELIVATNGAHLHLEIGTGAGPTYDTGNVYEWAMTGRTSGGAAATDNGATGLARVFNALTNTATYGFGTFSATATGLQSATLRKTIQGTVMYVNTAPVAIYGMWGMQYSGATAVTALRFIASSGNITSGTIRIYGLAK